MLRYNRTIQIPTHRNIMQPPFFHTGFLFHGSLNDFLRTRQKNTRLDFPCRFSSSVKDAIEANGVPHVEVGKIVVNGKEKPFDYLLQPGDEIDVFPYERQLPAGSPARFVLDVHLGGLARRLRMLGIDTIYRNDLHDPEIIAIATTENRVVLTRDVGLLKHKLLQWGYWLRSQQSEEQLLEVISRFSLCNYLQPFMRCIACNGLLATVAKNEIVELLPEKTRLFFEEFYRCTACGKIYWKGSHYQDMLRSVERIRSVACQ